MFEKFEDSVKEALMNLDENDLSHCMKMAKHFNHMGINPKVSGSALKGLAEAGIVDKLYQQA